LRVFFILAVDLDTDNLPDAVSECPFNRGAVARKGFILVADLLDIDVDQRGLLLFEAI